MQVYFLIDRSGSMADRWTETIAAVNSYVKDVKEKKKSRERIEVSVSFFDNVEPLKVAVWQRRVEDWQPLSDKENVPRGMTPLFDAIGLLYKRVLESKDKKAVIVILTDGQENSSLDVKKEHAKKMIDDFKDKGYDVVFIGADFDAFASGNDLGIAASSILNTSVGNYGNTLRMVAINTVSYNETGNTTSWSEEDRAIAAGKKK